MKEKDKEKQEPTAVFDSVDQAMRSYEQALQSGLKFQQKAWQSWCDVLNESAANQDWQKYYTQATSTLTDAMPSAQKRMAEGLELAEKNGRFAVELMKRAAHAAQAPTFADSQAKWIEFWRGSLEMARTNAEAILGMNSRAMDSWISVVQKNSEKAQAARA